MKTLHFCATLLVCALVFAACSKEKEDMTQQLIGKWEITHIDGSDAPTNAKMVFTLESATQGYVSASRVDYSSNNTKWANRIPCDVRVDGKTYTLTGNLNKTTTFVAEILVNSYSNTEMQTEMKYTVYHNGTPLYQNTASTSWGKVDRDYHDDIIGLWEGRITSSEGSEFDDGELHRWEYLADDSYVYYTMEADSTWVPKASEFCEYFVDGKLLCTRWKNVGEDENREWWEIASIEDGVMNWTALRLREDGTTYTATFQMTKVQ